MIEMCPSLIFHRKNLETIQKPPQKSVNSAILWCPTYLFKLWQMIEMCPTIKRYKSVFRWEIGKSNNIQKTNVALPKLGKLL